MSANRKVVTFAAVVLLFLVGYSLFAWWCWTVRETTESRRVARKVAVKAVREAKPESVVDELKDLAGKKVFHSWFTDGFPWLHFAFETRVPADFIAQLTEEAILRFAGDGTDGSEDVPRLKLLVAFAGEMEKRCETEAAVSSLRDRRFDGYFLMKDYDGAIAMLDAGMPSHSREWCKGTAAKLRAHKALDAGDKKSAAKHFLDFGDFLACEEMKDFEDCDPTTGIVYSVEWVIARNFMRVSKLLAETGDKAKAAEFAAKAKPNFNKALEKAKDDSKSLQALKEEIKAAGL